MKKTLRAIAYELIIIAIASTTLYFTWNEVVPTLFHYKDITWLQSILTTACIRSILIKNF